MVQKSLLIRADASLEIGTGHVMRCLALAQAWKDTGGSVSWVSAELPDNLQRRLAQESIDLSLLSTERGRLEDAGKTAEKADSVDAEWAVLDGYTFNHAYQTAVRKSGLKVLVLDDNGETGPWNCDAILNQNLHAKEIDYSSVPAGCQLLLGTSFCLLRRELRDALKQHTPAQDQEREVRLLLMMGGGDPDNVTGRILDLLSQFQTEKNFFTD